VSTTSRWLTWTPKQPKIIETFPETEPTQPTKPSFESFEGPFSGNNSIIRGIKPTTETLADVCPYALPEGVKLVHYTPKSPPVAVTVCSVVEDVSKFIQHGLDELDARLHRPVQIKAGDSVFELLSKLADCGLGLRLEWPSDSEIIEKSRELEPTKPSKATPAREPGPYGPITDEVDLPF